MMQNGQMPVVYITTSVMMTFLFSLATTRLSIQTFRQLVAPPAQIHAFSMFLRSIPQTFPSCKQPPPDAFYTGQALTAFYQTRSLADYRRLQYGLERNLSVLEYRESMHFPD